MNKKIIIILLISAALITIQNTFAEGQKESLQRTITVNGTGAVAAAPDTVRLNLGVQSMNRDLNTAIDDNDRRINAIIEVIRDYGIDENDFNTSNFSVYYQQPYNPETSPEEGVYNVNNNIFIELQNISEIGDFIEDALSAGANQFYGLEYSIKDSEPLIKEARKLAIEDAVALAEETAGYAGLTIGDIISIQEEPYYGAPLFAEGLGGVKRSNSLITVPGEKTIEKHVTLKIELKK